jgi:hypothetical protein
MSEWDGITGFEGWDRKLNTLLAEAKEAAKETALAKRLEVSERLAQFRENSWPKIPEIKGLDEIASQTASALLTQTIDERLTAISERTAAYQRLTKEFKANTEENQAKAQSIRLQGIRSVVDSATQIIGAVKALRESLEDNPEDHELAQMIDNTVKAIEDLRSRVGQQI